MGEKSVCASIPCAYDVEYEDGEPVYTGGNVTFGAFEATFGYDYDVLEVYINGADDEANIDASEIPDDFIVPAFYIKGHVAQLELDEDPRTGKH